MTKQVVATSVGLQRVFVHMFYEQWSGVKRDVPYCEVLKRREEVLSVHNGFIINHPDKYGDNLILANIGIMMFVDRLNDHIQTVNDDFKAMEGMIQKQKEDPSTDITSVLNKVSVNSEILAYYLKTIADKIIVLVCTMSGENSIDSIGTLQKLSKKSKLYRDVFKQHKDFLDSLNKIHNAYKHTFSNLQLISIIPQAEPAMFVIYKKNNSTKNPSEVHLMICSNAIEKFSSFIEDAREYTRSTK